MKKIQYIFGVFAVSCAALFASCGKEDLTNDDNLYETPFEVKVDGFGTENDKAIFNSSDYLKLIFQNNDQLYINGKPFTMKFVGGKWKAYGQASDMDNATQDSMYAVNGHFYSYFGMAPATSDPSFSEGSYFMPGSNISFTQNGPLITIDGSNLKTYNPGIIIAGRSDSTLLTLYPTFGIIRVYNRSEGTRNLNSLSVGFDANKVIRQASSIVPRDGNMPNYSGVTYMKGVSVDTHYDNFIGEEITEYSGEFLNATTDNLSDGFEDAYMYHVIVPLGSNSVSTSLYVKSEVIYRGTSYVRFNKFENATLQRGKVYTISL